MIIEKIKLKELIEKDKNFNNRRIHIHERISLFLTDINETNKPGFNEKDYNNIIFNRKRVSKWYLYRYGDVENRMKIPIILKNRISGKNKLFLVNYMYTYFVLNNGECPLTIDEKSKKVILYRGKAGSNYFRCNLYQNVCNAGINNNFSLKLKDKKMLIRLNGGLVWYTHTLAKIDRVKNNFFIIAYYDYQSSINNLIMHNYICSIWSSQQACEKLLKGILTEKNIEFPTSGRDGHNISGLLDCLNKNGIKITLPTNYSKRKLKNLNASVRYSGNYYTQEQAYEYALLYLYLLSKLKYNKVI